MTTEDKFKKLLDIACDNGFDKSVFFYNKDYNHIYEINKQFIHCDSGFNACSYSMNDLVLQTNFFDCLFKDFNGVVFTNLAFELYKGFETMFEANENLTIIEVLKFQWVLEVEKGTALEWLFKQFNL